MEHSNDITIPVVQITDGWTIDDLETMDDCDDAFIYLTDAICSIEHQIEQMEESGLSARKQRSALRWKKAALSFVNTKRSKINRLIRIEEQKDQDRQLVKIFADLYPKEFRIALDTIQAKLGDKTEHHYPKK